MKSPDRVAPETRERVNAILADTKYMPDPLAMGLASNRSNLVVILIPGIVSPIFAETNFDISRKLGEAGFLAVLCLRSREESEMDLMMRSVLARRPDAIIITGAPLSPAIQERVRSAGVTVIQTWGLPSDPIDVAIGFSQNAAGRAIASLLSERGHRSTFVISTEGQNSEDRLEGFREACRELGMEEPESEIVPIGHGFLNGRNCLSRLLAAGKKPDAVVCSSDLVAHGVLTQASASGLRVPEDIAVVGFGGTDIAASTIPSLTTLEIDSAEIARQVARVVLARDKGETLDSTSIDIGFRLIVRESV